MTDPGQLPDELAVLFDAERAAPTADATMRRAVRTRLAAVVTLLPAKAAAATSAATVLGGVGKIIAVVALAVGGVGTVAVLGGDEPPAAPSMALAASHDDSEWTSIRHHITQTEHVSDELVASASVQLPTINEKRTSSASNAPPSPAPSEVKLLKRAWSALSVGDAKQALDLTREAETLRDASLIEERRALEIQALAKLGLLIDARSAAHRFIVQFPESVHRAQVERVVTTVESP